MTAAEVLIVDNYDSFTFNLREALRQLGVLTLVAKNDQIAPEEAARFAGVVLSPGPGIPREAGRLLEIISRCAERSSLLGVCLGHQGIAEVFQGALMPVPEIVHGEAREIVISDPADPLFHGVPTRFLAGRYHSWAVNPRAMPGCFAITARTTDDIVMAIKHRERPVWGVQFHPESILTPHGATILRNWVKAMRSNNELRAF